MIKVTKVAIAILYLIQVEVIFHGQFEHLWQSLLETLEPEIKTISRSTGRTSLEPDLPAMSPDGLIIGQPLAIAQGAAAVAAMVSESDPMHSPEDKRHDKDRPRRHRRLHGFQGLERHFGNLASAIAVIATPAGHELGYWPAATPRTTFSKGVT
jgi:hypothetical protein